MSFSYSAGVITQTGTDTDLSGLSGLTGVTTRTESQIIYTLDDTDLRITGTLSYNGADERLEYINVESATSARPLTVTSTGDLTVVSSRTATKSFYPAIDFGSQSVAGVTSAPRSLTIDTGGVCSLEGLYIINAGAVNGGSMYINGVLTLNDCLLINLGTAGSTQITSNTGGTVNAINTTLRRLTVNAEKIILGTWSNFLFYECVECLIPRSQGIAELLVELANISYENITSYFARVRVVDGKVCFKVTNMLDGDTVPILATNDNPTVGQNYYLAYQTVNYSFVDAGGSPVTAKVYGKDVDNGSRIADFTVDGTPFAVANDIVYTTTGTSASFDVLYQLRYSNLNAGLVWTTVDNRGVSDAAIVKFHAINYAYDIVALQDYVVSSADYDATGFFIVDSLITESTKATVDAYTTLETPQKFYDRAKADLLDNYAGETATTILRTGTSIDLKTLNLTVNASGATVYDLTGSALTIKSSNYTGGFSNGTISHGSGHPTFNNLVLENATWNTEQETWTGSADSASTIDVATADTYNAVGFTFDSASTINNSSGGVVNIIISAGQQEPLTTGGTVNFLDAGASVSFISLTDATVEIYDQTNTSVSRVTDRTGTYIYTAPNGSTGTWAYIVDRVGYNRLRGTFNPVGVGAEVNGVLDQLLKSDNTPMYSGGAYPLVSVMYDFVTPCMCIEISDGIATAQQVMDASEDALLTVDGMRWQNEIGSLVRLDDIVGLGKRLQLGTNIRLKRALAGDVNAEVAAVISSIDGVVVDGVNGGVIYGNPASATDIATAVRTELTTELDRIDVATGSRSTFNPASDTVARVTLVDTTTANTDMRGTDGANTTAPDNAAAQAAQAAAEAVDARLPAEPATEGSVKTSIALSA